MARHFIDITAERYPCELDISSPEPIVTYLDSMADEPLTPQQQAAARNIIQAQIDVDGGYRVTKHSILITASH